MADPILIHERPGWVPASEEAEHPLAAVDGAELEGATLRVRLGPASRFGARYFVALAERDGQADPAPVLVALHHSGPYPSYNWIEVGQTAESLGEAGLEGLFGLLLSVVPPGGHLMVEYDSAQRSETAQGLAHGVPPIATPLGSMLFRLGCGAKFKDWQIAEGGSEGPRKLQAYKPPSTDDAHRWRHEASAALRTFLDGTRASSGVVRDAQERARSLLEELVGT